ncbi:hypothetical protein BX600DRAFT_224077 [Xylariales sp. PMI_506]|nr:hypothetical protein BX600DRAFT_224077 [Xylariales sp. PMI_506]
MPAAVHLSIHVPCGSGGSCSTLANDADRPFSPSSPCPPSSSGRRVPTADVVDCVFLCQSLLHVLTAWRKRWLGVAATAAAARCRCYYSGPLWKELPCAATSNGGGTSPETGEFVCSPTSDFQSGSRRSHAPIDTFLSASSGSVVMGYFG